MSFSVKLTAAARRDLFRIYDYIYDHDSPESAEYVLTKIEDQLSALSELPTRGAVVPEMSRLGDTRFREVFFKPYRIIYEVESDIVVVYMIADGRQNMERILLARLS